MTTRQILEDPAASRRQYSLVLLSGSSRAWTISAKPSARLEHLRKVLVSKHLWKEGFIKLSRPGKLLQDQKTLPPMILSPRLPSYEEGRIRLDGRPSLSLRLYPKLVTRSQVYPHTGTRIHSKAWSADTWGWDASTQWTVPHLMQQSTRLPQASFSASTAESIGPLAD